MAGNTGSTLGSEEILLQSSKRSTSIHAGGWVDFKPSDAGKNVGSHDIYWSAGDSGPQTDPEKHGQNVNNLHSTIARISVPSTGTGYSIPAGNLNKGNFSSFCIPGFLHVYNIYCVFGLCRLVLSGLELNLGWSCLVFTPCPFWYRLQVSHAYFTIFFMYARDSSLYKNTVRFV